MATALPDAPEPFSSVRWAVSTTLPRTDFGTCADAGAAPNDTAISAAALAPSTSLMFFFTIHSYGFSPIGTIPTISATALIRSLQPNALALIARTRACGEEYPQIGLPDRGGC
jgi:hypothetical protein